MCGAAHRGARPAECFVKERKKEEETKNKPCVNPNDIQKCVVICSVTYTVSNAKLKGDDGS